MVKHDVYIRQINLFFLQFLKKRINNSTESYVKISLEYQKIVLKILLANKRIIIFLRVGLSPPVI